MSDLSTLAGQREHYKSAKERLGLHATTPIVKAPVQRRRKRQHEFLPLGRPRDYIHIAQDVGEREMIRIMTGRAKPTRILEETHRETGLSPVQLVARARNKEIVAARHKVFWRLVNECGLSNAEVGRMFGMDPTTVLHGVRQHKKRIEAGVA